MSRTNSVLSGLQAGRSRAMLLAFAAVITLTGLHASASEPAGASPQTVIETRRASLKKMGAAMKAIVEQLKTGAPDTAKMAAAAQAISAGAEPLISWFPVGSGPESGADTDALPHIWEDRAKFE